MPGVATRSRAATCAREIHAASRSQSVNCRFAVHEVLPLHVPTLRTWLRERGVTGVTIKKRGVRLDDDHLRSQLKIGRGAGSGAQATVVLTRVAGGQVALVVDPA